jgi:hypothetical protein
MAAVKKTEGNISAKQVQELLKLGWVRDDALSDRWSEARILPDGRAIMFHGEGIFGILFPSRAALSEQRRKGEELLAHGRSIDLTVTLLPPVADFIRDVEAHAASLGKVLRLPDEALDRTEASLDAVDAAMMRVRRAKRMTPEVVTPLMAYVGEVMRHACSGHWTPPPTTWTRRVPIYDPVELSAYQQLRVADIRAAQEAQEKAVARGASLSAQNKPFRDLVTSPKHILASPKPIGFKEVTEPLSGSKNEPVIKARDGRLLSPFRLVVVPMWEPSKRVPLRGGVDVMVMRYRPGFQPGPPGTLRNPVARPIPPLADLDPKETE